ncbi:TetR/AcrR family transcriptional regulator [Ollibium composti]|uniref:TetR/AcrR family transcriptional regulator n=1 Tax=Ollibium composti TaxID=2675109 RepID=A0ABY2Q543_9HYPH|nr:TetR/AcrR family transcriptional regulator [Mesorhizobium composti]THF56452.1 TetR/AcrR family transcriptional regulator [Mesorhizobium composti]
MREDSQENGADRYSSPAAGSGSTGNVRATKEDWLKLALETLICDGVDGVRILTLGQKLGISRSSFYWYFKSRQDLLDQLLQYWRERNTRGILAQSLLPATSVTQGVLNVFECWYDEDLFNPRLDFAVRAWANGSSEVRKVVDLADGERVEAIYAMFLRCGCPQSDALIRARILYFTQIGYYALEIVESIENRLAHLPAYLRIHAGKDPLDGEVEAFVARALRRVDTRQAL